MKIGVVIPFRGLKLGKSRLRAHLPAPIVETLSQRMLENVIRAVRGAAPDAPIVLITRARTGLTPPHGVTVVEQPLDLNEAIEFARVQLREAGADRIAVVSSDLALVQASDINALLAPAADVVLATDEAERGTNALIFPAAEASFCRFGAESAQLHAAEALRRGLSIAHVRTPALARDIDTPDHLDDAVRAACAPAFRRD